MASFLVTAYACRSVDKFCRARLSILLHSGFRCHCMSRYSFVVPKYSGVLDQCKWRHIPQRWFRVRSQNSEKKVVSNRVISAESSRGNQKNLQSSSKTSQDFKAFNVYSFMLGTAACGIGFCAIVFGGCAIWQAKNIEKERTLNRNNEVVKRVKKENSVYTEISHIWGHLSMVQRVTYAIIGFNFAVWTAWKVGNPHVMTKWFTLSANADKNHFRGILLSMFSHKSFIHLYLNMYVLSSFSVAWNQLSITSSGKSINRHERFLAFYLCAGMCSGLLSIVVKVLGKIPHPSLGASGAIMGLIGYVCEKMPNNLLSVVFFPDWSFKASSAKWFLIIFDVTGLVIGIVSRWRHMFLDHAGHLGGIMFGIWYAYRGENFFNRFSRYISDRRET